MQSKSMCVLSYFTKIFIKNGPGSVFFTLKSFLRVVRSHFVFLHILWNLGNVLKSYSVAIGGVENFLRAEQAGKFVKHQLCFET